MYCPKCGTNVNDTASSCSNCNLSLTKATPFSPYNPEGDNSFTLGISLLTLFPLLGFLLPVAVDMPLVKMLGMAIGVLCPLVGIGAIVMSTTADKNHRVDNEPAARKTAKTAKMISLAGWAVGFPVTVLAIGIAFLNFLSGGTHEKKSEKKAAAEAPADEAAPAEGAAPAEAAPAGEPGK